eukprot:Hpha_TRINITY_DN15013_c0_g3::TRINITY_DN15013_c0_g3_i1::g.126183::m.126183
MANPLNATARYGCTPSPHTPEDTTESPALAPLQTASLSVDLQVAGDTGGSDESSRQVSSTSESSPSPPSAPPPISAPSSELGEEPRKSSGSSPGSPVSHSPSALRQACRKSSVATRVLEDGEIIKIPAAPFGACQAAAYAVFLEKPSELHSMYKNLSQAFRLFDVDDSGTISPEELAAVLQMLGSDKRPEDVKRLVEQMDTGQGGDG